MTQALTGGPPFVHLPGLLDRTRYLSVGAWEVKNQGEALSGRGFDSRRRQSQGD